MKQRTYVRIIPTSLPHIAKRINTADSILNSTGVEISPGFFSRAVDRAKGILSQSILQSKGGKGPKDKKGQMAPEDDNEEVEACD